MAIASYRGGIWFCWIDRTSGGFIYTSATADSKPNGPYLFRIALSHEKVDFAGLSFAHSFWFNVMAIPYWLLLLQIAVIFIVYVRVEKTREISKRSQG